MKFKSSMICWALWTTASVMAEPDSAGERVFALHVQGLLAEKCLACHGDTPAKLKGELDLRTREAMLRGGESSSEVLVPGDASASLLYLAASWEDSELQMPPKEKDRLSEEQLGHLRHWIEAGAPWPSKEVVEGIGEREAQSVRVATSGGLTQEWTHRRYLPENLWAYQPWERPPVPRDTGSSHPIDAFISAQRVQLGVEPAPLADRATLLRRVTYGLTGLPPTPGEVRAFLDDPADDAGAWARLIDRLLASPRYGEQMARHWLDVVRYADSAGFANDFERPNAWRYRDYVVRSFQRDKPYDVFVRQQLAGDEMDATDPENLIAVGFLRMGPWEQTGMSVAKITRQQFLDDVTASVGQVFLAQAFQCARCHDHKFDPVPTRDYYSIQAAFATTQFAGREAAWLPTENTGGFEEGDYLRQRLQRYRAILAEIRKKEEAAARVWYAIRGLPYIARREALRKGISEDQIVPARIGLNAHDLGMERIARKNLVRHQWELDRYQPLAYSVYSGKTALQNAVNKRLPMPGDPMKRGELEHTAILAGGDLFSPGERVSPGVLSAVTRPGHATLTRDIEGRRLAFAKWVTQPGNPLTSRVMVNRVWSWHFGRGLAGNPNNFGATGKKPTHPELLDWLAAEFIDSGWSVKAIHRLILTSQTYQRSARSPRGDGQMPRGASGHSYATFRPRRLAAEELRDSMLAVSGELNPQLGGIPVRPDIVREAALQPRMIMGTYAPAYQPSPGPAQRNRRTLYAIKIRGLRDPFLEVFNQPGPDESCELRQTSTVTPQVFSLFNGEEAHDRALALAARVLKEGDGQAVQRLFQLVYQRAPSSGELVSCERHWQEMTVMHERGAPEPRTLPTKVLRRAKEEVTGESFEFVEQLEVAADYLPDLQPHQVDARTRGLAEVCLVLLNSNEFAYVY